MLLHSAWFKHSFYIVTETSTGIQAAWRKSSIFEKTAVATYYLGPHLAGRSVLLQVRAEQRQFAVWSQDQIVKLLPIKGLVGQEMILDDYLQHIKQEALTALDVLWGVRPGKFDSLLSGEKGLDLRLHRRRSQTLAPHSGKRREDVVSSRVRTTGKAENICEQDTPCDY
jgi:hypothetical protein